MVRDCLESIYKVRFRQIMRKPEKAAHPVGRSAGGRILDSVNRRGCFPGVLQKRPTRKVIPHGSISCLYTRTLFKAEERAKPKSRGVAG